SHETRSSLKVEATPKRIKKEFQKEDALRRKLSEVMKRERNSGIWDFEHGMRSKVGVVVKNELKRGNSGLCERISANDVEIQYRESKSVDLEVYPPTSKVVA
ncbi:hypothetical protein Tco_1259505, partial [Tanacetum coccineum]